MTGGFAKKEEWEVSEEDLRTEGEKERERERSKSKIKIK